MEVGHFQEQASACREVIADAWSENAVLDALALD
jgi:hypothetical protein